MERRPLSIRLILFTLILLICSTFSLFAGPYPESEIQEIYSSQSYALFFSTIYNVRPLKDIESQLKELKREITGSEYSATAKSLAVVRAEMILAKHLILEDYCKDLERAEAILQRGLVVLSQIPEGDRDIEFLLVKGELNGSYYLIDQGKYLFSYGMRSNNLTHEVWDLDQDNPRSILLRCNQLIYTPPLFGGSVKKARTLLLEILEDPLLEVDEYTVYSCLGMIESKLKHKDIALTYYLRSLEIYPHNSYIQSLIAEL